MDADKKEKCHAIIHTASAATAGVAAGLAQIPLTDGALIVPIQITMIVGLGKVFDVEITESVAKAVALSMAAMYVGRAISQVLVGWIPVLESVRKHHAGLQSFRNMRRIEARRKNASALRLRFSQSLASLRQRFSHAIVRSTIHRFGRTTKVCNSLRLMISMTQSPLCAAAIAASGP